MVALSLMLVAFIVYLIYKITQMDHAATKFKAKLRMHLRSSNLKSDDSSTKQLVMTDEIKTEDDESDDEKALFNEFKEMKDWHTKNYNSILSHLKDIKAREKREAPKVQHIIGPHNNNNVRVNLQLNVLPLLGGGEPSSMLLPVGRSIKHY